MRDFLTTLLKTPDESPFEITLFSLWHMLYVVVILGVTLFLCLFFKKKSDSTQHQLTNVLAILPISLYFADYLLMPLAYGAIDIDKLPFHFCTMLSLLILPIQFGHGKTANFWREPITALSIVTPLMYLCYPGSAIGDITPFCYRVIQTFLYHGAVFAYGVASVSLHRTELRRKNIWRSAVLICAFIIWASFGNAAYSTEDHHFDWCFVTGSTFPFIPSPIMPLAVLACVFGMVAIIYAISYGLHALFVRQRKLRESVN